MIPRETGKIIRITDDFGSSGLVQDRCGFNFKLYSCIDFFELGYYSRNDGEVAEYIYLIIGWVNTYISGISIVNWFQGQPVSKCYYDQDVVYNLQFIQSIICG